MHQDGGIGGPPAYAELLVHLSPGSGQECRVDMEFTPAGAPARTEWRGHARFDLDDLREVQNDLDEYARRLSGALFADQRVREGFMLAMALAGAQQLRLRLYVDAEMPELHALRWETLQTPDGVSVATGDRVLFSRYLRSPDWRRVQTVSERKLRALIMIANPSDLTRYAPQRTPLQPIDVVDELARARRALGSVPSITVFAERGSATLEHLVQGIHGDHNIIYLVCHGAFQHGETCLYLERASGETVSVKGSELVTQFAQLRKLPSLVVLASCQSAGSGAAGALTAVGPLLAQVGVPSVLAMQDRISVDTSARFVETFFHELSLDGRLDRAAAVARTSVKNEPDFWVPVLFSRLSNGRLWQAPSEERTEFKKWPALIDQLDMHTCTPILGPGLIEFLLGPSREMAQRWADTYHFPMSPHARQDLPQVAEFLAVAQNPSFPARELGRYVHDEIVQRYGQLLDRDVADDREAYVRALVSEVGRLQRSRKLTDPYRVLAHLPCPIYVSANPDNLLADALQEAGKRPIVQLAHWSNLMSSGELPTSIWDDEPEYVPTVERPLVYHVFGQMRDRQSLVLTEDNFFDFLLGAGKAESIPKAIAAAWSKNALLFLGFQMDDWNFRVLFRAIMSQPGRQAISNRRGDGMTHVAVQIDPEEGGSFDPHGAREYLEQYFNDEHIDTYLGSTENFVEELWAEWQRRPGGPLKD